MKKTKIYYIRFLILIRNDHPFQMVVAYLILFFLIRIASYFF